MRLYKLTDQNGYTRRGKINETLWGENVTHEAKGQGNTLCTDGVIHAYTSLYIAVLMNPHHARFNDPIAWIAEGEVIATDHQIKCGVKSLTTVKQIPLPIISLEQRIKIAIHCSLKVYKEPKYIAWAKNWLNGKDRDIASASAAASAAYAASASAVSDASASYAASAASAASAAAYAAYAVSNAAVSYAAVSDASYAVSAAAVSDASASASASAVSAASYASYLNLSATIRQALRT